jgi:DNA mismatch repair ATPase MutL
MPQFQVSGFVARQGSARKSFQYVYINKRLVLRTPLHKLANRIFANSLLSGMCLKAMIIYSNA